MLKMEWKILILAALAASLLVACQNKSDDAAATPPSSPYQGFWVSTHTTQQVESCRGQVFGQVSPLDAIYIEGDGTVVARDYGYGMRDGMFANFDGNRMKLMDIWHREQNREYTRTTETQLQNYLAELNRCAGQGYPRFAQIQPPDGMPPTYPRNVDPRLVSPGQDMQPSQSPPQGHPQVEPQPYSQQREPVYRDQGGYPPPPEYGGGGRMGIAPGGRY